MGFMTQIQLPSGKTVSLKWLNRDHERRNRILGRIQDQSEQVLCRCRREGLLIHIKRKGQGRHLARNPNSSALHHPNCDFYDSSPLVSGSSCDERQKTTPRYIAHQIWESSGLNQWTSGMVDDEGRPKRSIDLALALASKLMANPWTEREKGMWAKGNILDERVTLGLLTSELINFVSSWHSIASVDTLKRLASGMAQSPISTLQPVTEFKRWACVTGEGKGAKAYTFLTNENLLPVSNSWELSLIDSLCKENDTVIRPIWYVADKRSFPSAIVIEDHKGVGIFIRGYHSETSAVACASKYHLNAKWLDRR